ALAERQKLACARVLPADLLLTQPGRAGAGRDAVRGALHAPLRPDPARVPVAFPLGPGPPLADGSAAHQGGHRDHVALDLGRLQHGLLPGGAADRRQVAGRSGAHRRRERLAGVLARDAAVDASRRRVRGDHDRHRVVPAVRAAADAAVRDLRLRHQERRPHADHLSQLPRFPLRRSRPGFRGRLGHRDHHLHHQLDPDPHRAADGGLGMRRAVLIVCVFAGLAAARTARSEVLAVDGVVRLRREDAALARRVGERLPAAGGTVSRAAQRGETIAFQIVVVAADRPIGKTELTLSEPVGPGGARLRTDLFRQHYRHVAARSRNERTPNESLGWHPGARPPDRAMLGDVPDALLPVAVDPRPVTGPIAVAAGATGAFWVDVDVPDGAPPGRYQGDGKLEADGAVLAAFTIAIDVRPTPLPFGAAGVFIYYE